MKLKLLFLLIPTLLLAQPEQIKLYQLGTESGTLGQVPVLSGSPLGWHPANVLSRILSGASFLPVEPYLNFVNGGCVDNSGSTRIDCTIAAVSRIYNAGSLLPVEPFLNFVSGGCVDNAGATRTDCTDPGITALTGDVTASGPGSAAATLATVNAGPGSCGDATHVCQVTVNAKGLTTVSAQVAINTGFLAPVAATYSAAATTGALAHNFASVTHSVQCTNAGGFFVVPSSITVGSNSDTLNFLGGLQSSTTCVASR